MLESAGGTLEGTGGAPPASAFLNGAASTEDSIRDLKKLIAAQTGTRWDKIVLKKW